MNTRKRFTKNEIEEMVRNTSFLPSDAENTQRKWHIENNIYIIPKCKICNNIVKWYRQRFKYSDYCSVECSLKSPERLKKVKETNILKFGTEHAIGSNIVRNKIKDTFLRKYGVENSFLSNSIKEKINTNIKKKYGVHTTLLVPDVQEKIKQTNKKRYGVENPSQNKDIQYKTKQTNLDKYGVEHLFQSEDIKEKIKNTNIERYGVENPSQKHLPQETLNNINDTEWLRRNHHDEKKSITEMSIEANVDATTISNKLSKYNIEKVLYNTSIPQKEITIFIEQYTSVLYNTRSIIPPLEIDIYLPEYNIAIEFCGLYWHSEMFKTKDYHRDKYIKCKENGIRLLTIYENEWTYKKDIIKSKLLNLLHLHHDKVYARKCSIDNINIKYKNTFYNKYHIQGSGPGSINIGLYNNDLVACISFINNKNGTYVLNRYATSKQVVGGFSKLLKYFIRTYSPKKIITFADLRWSNGDLYNRNNFIEDGIIDPDYQYIIRDMTYHKFGFRHIHMKNKLQVYDPDLTERQNCLNNKIYRIYDCGKIRFSYNGLE